MSRTMRCVPCLCLMLLLIAASVTAAGDIQVLCEPGLRVLLDGKLVGISSTREDGLFLDEVSPGKHTVLVEKEGFVPRSYQVEVGHLPIEVRVEPLDPEPLDPEPLPPVETKAPSARPPQVLGRLSVTSAPQNCTVEIDGRAEEKTTPQLTVGGLAAGEHTISFRKPGYSPVSASVVVQPGATVTVRGDLRAGKVEATHEGKGSLRLRSKPNRCTVRLGGKTMEKTSRVLNQSHLPAGEYRLEVSIPGQQLATSVVIMDGRRTIVEASFMKGDEPFAVSHEPE